MTSSRESEAIGAEHVAKQAAEEQRVLRNLKRLFRYEPRTGEFVGVRDGVIRTWRNGTTGAGVLDVDGTRKSTMGLVWLWHHGTLSPPGARHKNGDASDDRIENIYVKLPGRVVEGCNRNWVARTPSRHRSGQMLLGSFKTYEAALAAYESHVAGADLV